MGIFDFIKGKQYSESLEFYNSMFPQRIDPDPMKNQFVILDTEATGLSKEDEIVSIGAIMLEEATLDPSKTFELTLSTNKRSEESLAIHEVLGNNRESKKDIEKEFLSFIADKIIVGHHIQFDLKMIENWISIKYPGFEVRNRWIDTCSLAKRLHKEELSRMVGGNHFLGLDNLLELYEIPVENRHTALGDAYMTGLLFIKLVERMKKRGIRKTNEFL